MKCITEAEVKTWLGKRGIAHAPLFEKNASGRHLQFDSPSPHLRIDAFIRHYLSNGIWNQPIMIHITDWPLYKPSEMLVIDAIRLHHRETRALIKAPGHLVLPKEKETAIALFSLTISYGWNSYLYSEAYKNILYNWEGQIVDFWTHSADQYKRMLKLMRTFKLKRK